MVRIAMVVVQVLSGTIVVLGTGRMLVIRWVMAEDSVYPAHQRRQHQPPQEEP